MIIMVKHIIFHPTTHIEPHTNLASQEVLSCADSLHACSVRCARDAKPNFQLQNTSKTITEGKVNIQPCTETCRQTRRQIIRGGMLVRPCHTCILSRHLSSRSSLSAISRCASRLKTSHAAALSTREWLFYFTFIQGPFYSNRSPVAMIGRQRCARSTWSGLMFAIVIAFAGDAYWAC